MKTWRFAVLTLVTAGACSDPFTVASVVPDRAALFDEVWHQVDLHYSFFALKHINWDSVGAQYRPRALAAPTDYTFALTLASMLDQLKDVHVSISPGGAGSTIRYVSRSDTTPTFFTSNMVFERYITGPTLSPSGHFRFGMLAPTVGYVYIRDFEGKGWGDEIDEAILSLPLATRFVVDVRDNSGGNYTLAVDIAGRFADKKRTYAYIKRRNGPDHDDFTGFTAETVEPIGKAHFDGPVYVLSNRRDFSSAEDFILAMRVSPNVTVVGDTTAGASGGPIVRELANGWTYQVSEWIEYTSTHDMFEGVGLAPDVVVTSSAAEAARGVDPIIARALHLAESSPAGSGSRPRPATGSTVDSSRFSASAHAGRHHPLPTGRHER